jgi:hypothetical protein
MVRFRAAGSGDGGCEASCNFDKARTVGSIVPAQDVDPIDCLRERIGLEEGG